MPCGPSSRTPRPSSAWSRSRSTWTGCWRSIAVVLFPLAGLPLRFFSNALRQNSRRQQEATARMTAMLHENVQGNRIVKLFGQERYEAGALPRAGRAHLQALHAQQPHALAADHRAAGRHRHRRHHLLRRCERDRGHADAGQLLRLHRHGGVPVRALQEAGAHELHHPAGHRRGGAGLRAARHAGARRRSAERRRAGGHACRASSSTTCGSSTSRAGRCCAASTCASRPARSSRWWG